MTAMGPFGEARNINVYITTQTVRVNSAASGGCVVLTILCA